MEPNLPAYLIGQTNCFGVGVTLNQAFAIGLLEPAFNPAEEGQLFARHCRIFNLFSHTECWSFLAKDNSVERRITDKNRVREMITSTVARKVGEATISATKALAERGSEKGNAIVVEDDK